MNRTAWRKSLRCGRLRLASGLGALVGILILAGCGATPWLNQEVAQQLAFAFADPASGYTQESEDYGGYLFDSEAVVKTALAPKIVAKGSSYTLYFSGNYGSFVWDSADQAY